MAHIFLIVLYMHMIRKVYTDHVPVDVDWRSEGALGTQHSHTTERGDIHNGEDATFAFRLNTCVVPPSSTSVKIIPRSSDDVRAPDRFAVDNIAQEKWTINVHVCKHCCKTVTSCEMASVLDSNSASVTACVFSGLSLKTSHIIAYFENYNAQSIPKIAVCGHGSCPSESSLTVCYTKRIAGRKASLMGSFEESVPRCDYICPQGRRLITLTEYIIDETDQHCCEDRYYGQCTASDEYLSEGCELIEAPCPGFASLTLSDTTYDPSYCYASLHTLQTCKSKPECLENPTQHVVQDPRVTDQGKLLTDCGKNFATETETTTTWNLCKQVPRNCPWAERFQHCNGHMYEALVATAPVAVSDNPSTLTYMCLGFIAGVAQWIVPWSDTTVCAPVSFNATTLKTRGTCLQKLDTHNVSRFGPCGNSSLHVSLVPYDGGKSFQFTQGLGDWNRFVNVQATDLHTNIRLCLRGPGSERGASRLQFVDCDSEHLRQHHFVHAYDKLTCDVGEAIVNDKCVQCGEGTYSDSRDADNGCIVHVPCDRKNQIEVYEGSPTSPIICASSVACLPNQYESAPRTNTTDRQCTEKPQCPAGRYVEQNVCVDCEAGTFANSVASTSCTSCANGQYSYAKASKCQTPLECDTHLQYEVVAPTVTSDRQCNYLRVCEPGKYVSASSDNADRQCTDCAAGTYSARVNQQQCTDNTLCPHDTYVSREQTSNHNQECTDCQSGRYNEHNNTLECRELQFVQNRRCALTRYLPAMTTSLEPSRLKAEERCQSWCQNNRQTEAVCCMAKMTTVSTGINVTCTSRANSVLIPSWTNEYAAQVFINRTTTHAATTGISGMFQQDMRCPTEGEDVFDAANISVCGSKCVAHLSTFRFDIVYCCTFSNTKCAGVYYNKYSSISLVPEVGTFAYTNSPASADNTRTTVTTTMFNTTYNSSLLGYSDDDGYVPFEYASVAVGILSVCALCATCLWSTHPYETEEGTNKIVDARYML